MQAKVIIIFVWLYFILFTTFVLKYIYMKESLTIRLDNELLAFLKKEAQADFRSVNNYVEMILLKYKLEQEQKEKPQS